MYKFDQFNEKKTWLTSSIFPGSDDPLDLACGTSRWWPPCDARGESPTVWLTRRPFACPENNVTTPVCDERRSSTGRAASKFVVIICFSEKKWETFFIITKQQLALEKDTVVGHRKWSVIGDNLASLEWVCCMGDIFDQTEKHRKLIFDVWPWIALG